MKSLNPWNSPIFHRHILYKAPIAARADLDIPDALIGDHHIGGVPKRKQGQFLAYYLLAWA